MLSTLDLFLVGLGCDISGAVLLARGLLVSPESISKLSGSYWNYNPPDAVDRCQNRVDAQFGVAALVAGFALQLVGYALDLGDVDAARGGTELAVGLALTVLAAGGVWAAWWRLRRRVLKPLLVEVARQYEPKNDPGPGWTTARLEYLHALGEAAGYPNLDVP